MPVSARRYHGAMEDAHTPTAQADRIVAQERAQRPPWRDSATKLAPSWFRGEALDLAEPAERRALYLAATAKVGPVPWQQFLGLFFLSVYFEVKPNTWAWHWPIVIAVLGAIGSTLLRRRLIRRLGREAMRESADWPQRLAQQQG